MQTGRQKEMNQVNDWKISNFRIFRKGITFLSNDIHVIESDDYRKEVEVLKQDPIILDMYDEIPASYISVTGFMDSYEFMVSCSEEYNRREGTNAISIGGPARAIKEIHRERYVR